MHNIQIVDGCFEPIDPNIPMGYDMSDPEENF